MLNKSGSSLTLLALLTDLSRLVDVEILIYLFGFETFT